MSILAPASSNSFLISSDFSLDTPKNIAFGTLSIRSLASFNPKEVILRIIFITFMRFGVGTSFKITSNSVFSSIVFSFVLLLSKKGTEFSLKGKFELAETEKVFSK